MRSPVDRARLAARDEQEGARALLPVQPQQNSGGTVAVATAEQQQMVETAPAQTANPQRGIASYLTGAANDGGVLAPPKKKRKAEPETEQIEHGDQVLTIFKGTHAAEDKRWVGILEIKENHTKLYKCFRCGHSFVGKVDKIVSHCLRIDDGKVRSCTRLPTDDQRDVLGRLQSGSSRTLVVAASKTKAVAMTPSIVSGLSAQGNKIAAVDEAVAKLVATKDLSWSAFDSRDPLWCAVVAAIQAAGPTYKPAARQNLSEHRPLPEGTRPGGLYLALESTRHERRRMFATATGEMSTGGTLVSDGAKLTTRKRGMLNSSLVVPKGVLFLQSTDATGKTKNGEFLRDDLSSALEKAGPFDVVSRTKPSGEVVQKKSSKIAKFCVLDRGGGCPRAIKLLEELWRVVGDTCKGHGADLLIEDLAKPFKPHLKQVHELILFIINHDVLYGLFTSYEGTRALAIPGETRFATEIICVRSLLGDMEQTKKLFVDAAYDAWHQKQDPSTKTKSRKMKSLALSDAFWHKSTVFVSLTEVVETSLRILDSDVPNMKDAAFAFYRIEKEIADPLTSKLAKIPEWGEIDLGLELGAEYLGSLSSYAKAMVKKRKADWLSPNVIAAAAVNPIYSFVDKEEERWAVPGGDAAVRTVISKLYWGEDALQSDACEGWDRFDRKLGIYDETGDEYGVLKHKVENAPGFFRHVAGSSSLQADKAFAQLATWLVSAFSNQGASERTNKYLAEIHTKKRARLGMEKGEAMLEIKMHELYKQAQRRATKEEQRLARPSVAEDLRLTYERARGLQLEKRALQLRMAALRQEERDAAAEEQEEEQQPLLTTLDACEVLGEGEVPLRVPAGFAIIQTAPSAAQLDSFDDASDELLFMDIMVRFEHFGWCKGTITSKVTKRSRTINKEQINFTAEFDIDDGASTDLSLEVATYDTSPSADYESWLLLEPAPPPADEAPPALRA